MAEIFEVTQSVGSMQSVAVFQARPYSFNFGVDDEYSGVDYKRAESR